MARECGWSAEEIIGRLTLDQLYRMYELVQVEKMKEERLRALAVAKATAYAFGSLKMDDFNEFMDALYAPKKDVVKSLDEAKDMGFLEEGNG